MNSNTHAMSVDSDGDSDEFFDIISIPDSDTDSGSLNGEDLREDFSKALRADATFTGSYFCCSSDESAPNPALKVAGVGLLELPLSEGGARLITSVASPVRAAEGQNANSVWEVGASNLAVGDAAWQDYLANAILPSVSDQLGFAQFTKSNVQIELSKLMLLGPGSDSFMHHTEETRGTNEFGKLAVFLPSPFEGGQIKISRPSKHKAFDINVASVSANTTSVAWYNDDVVPETMPVTAGYQLVLIYRLVHSGSILTKPSLRFATDRSISLGGVLGRWKKGGYEHLPSAPLLVLPLSKVYRPQSLKDGADILEDSDAEMVASLLPVAHDHGFLVCLANVVPSVQKTAQQALTLFNLERITDGPDPGRSLSFGELAIPNDAFMHNEGIEGADANCSVRTGLVVFRDEDEMPIAIALQGAESTFRHLSKRGPLRPTAANRQLTRAVLKSLGRAKEQGDDHPKSMGLMRLSVVEGLLECAVSWNDVKLWKDTLPYAHGLPVLLVLPLFRKAFPTFDVALIGDGVNNLIIRAPNLEDRLMLVEAILPLLPNDNAGLSWANGAVDAILSSYRDSKVEDVPILIRLAVRHAALALILKIISNVSESAVPLSDACSFLLELAKEIHRNIDAFSSPPKSTAKRHPQTTATKVIRFSMNTAIAIFAKGFKSMEDVVQDRDEDKSCASRSAFNVDQICEILELCLTVNDLVPCRILLETISGFLPEEGDIKNGSSTEDLFEKTYLPLISRLNELLQSRGIDITGKLFQPFFKKAISAYLAYLSRASVASQQVRAARIAIGCRNLEYCLPCQALETFVNSHWTEYRFAMDLNRRTHLEGEIKNFLRVNEDTLPNGCLTSETLKHTSPHILVVRKFSSLIQVSEEEKAKMVYEFLQSLSRDGTLAVAEKIMEEMWEEVKEKYLEEMLEDDEENCQREEGPSRAKGKEKMKADPERRRSSASVLVRRVKEEEDDGRGGARRKSSPSAFRRLRVKKEED